MNDEVPCKDHPDAPHGFCRDASHSYDRYVCECEFWEPPEQAEQDRFANVGKAIIEAAVLAEREACAKVCEETKAPKIRDEWSAGQTTGCSSCAAAIRARGEK